MEEAQLTPLSDDAATDGGSFLAVACGVNKLHVI